MSDQLLKPFPVLQVRLRMPFDDLPGSRNLLSKLLAYKKVLDVQNSITYIPYFINALDALITKKATGIYNVVNPGSISPYQIIERYKELVDPAHKVERLTLEGLAGVVRADRSNCILSGEKLKKEGITMLPVLEAVDRVIKNFATSK
jgi:dTDP-4-dehydrorhamnose reductase